ncbi:ATP-binding cassette domain-containing protein [Streptomyces sp. NPDC005336]|uniref:ATP-binding cassette domain-containing protein n=1 Tax=Streptomyces sp. NPDC005336 TaxID=3157035 RepID=UPI0033B87015
MRAVLARFLRASGRGAAVSLLPFLVLGAVTQGIAFALVVPIADDLFTPDTPVPWAWIAALAAVAVVHSVLHYRSVPMGNRLGADLVTTLHKAVAERTAELPARSLGTAHADRLAALNGSAVVVLMGLPAHVLRPLVAAVVTPLTVIVISAFVSPFLAATLAGGLLVLVAAAFGAARLLTRTEEPDGAEWLRRTYERPASAPRGRTSSVLLPAVGEALPWRVIELAVCAAVGVCAALSTGDDLSPAKSVALVVLSVLTFQPVMEAALLTSTVMNARATLTTIGRLIEAGDLEPPGASWPERCDIEFADVSLVVAGATVLDGVSFRIPAGSTTAILGTPDGARLELGDVLTGDLVPTSGRVRIGGVDISAIAVRDIDRRVSRISPTAPDLTRQDAARFLESTEPAGAPGASPLGERPAVRAAVDRVRETLSAGSSEEPALPEADRWRLALVRAMAQDPALVIVDATAGADVFATDPDLAELVSALARDRTCCVIPGAGFPLPPCDEELVLEGARITVRTAEMS